MRAPRRYKLARTLEALAERAKEIGKATATGACDAFVADGPGAVEVLCMCGWGRSWHAVRT